MIILFHNITVGKASVKQHETTLVLLYLQTEFVEEVVDEVFGAVDDAIVQMLSCDVVKYSSRDWRRDVIFHSVEILVTVNGHFERQEGQH